MITLEEFLKLYCDDHMAKIGVPLISADKIGDRMRIDPRKTKKDLDDYGINDTFAYNGITEAQIFNVRTGEKHTFTMTDDERLEDFIDDLLSEEDEEVIDDRVPFLDLLK